MCLSAHSNHPSTQRNCTKPNNNQNHPFFQHIMDWMKKINFGSDMGWWWKSNRRVEDSPHRPKNKWTGRHYGLSENVSRIWLNMERFGQRWVKMVAEWKSWVKMVKKERYAQTGRMSNLSLHTGCTPTVWPSWYIMIIQDTITSSSSWFWWANLWWGPWCFKTTKREKKWQLESVGKNVEIGLILVSKSLISRWPMIRMIVVHPKRRELTIGLSAEKSEGKYLSQWVWVW